MILKNLTSNIQLTLSHDLHWIDEHAWSPVTSNSEYSITGSLILESAVKQTGRSISLESPDNEIAWHTRYEVDTLRAWAAIPGLQMSLTLDDGRQFNVVFRHHEPPAFDATPILGTTTFAQSDPWQFKLKLMEI